MMTNNIISLTLYYIIQYNLQFVSTIEITESRRDVAPLIKTMNCWKSLSVKNENSKCDTFLRRRGNEIALNKTVTLIIIVH